MTRSTRPPQEADRRAAPTPGAAASLDDPVLAGEWMAVARSDEIGDAPVQVKVLGRTVVVWRGGAGLHAFRDLCIHRGTALSLGRVVDDTLVCPYHGWRYDGDGRCVRIPAQPEGAAIPTKARAERYACAERYGLVWVSLAPSTPAPPAFEEGDDDAFHTLICGPYRLAAEAPRVLENFLDVSHLMWVHEGLLGVPDHAEIPDYRVRDEGDALVSDEITIFQPDPDGRGKVVDSHYVYKVLRPLTARFAKRDADTGETFSMLIHATPAGPRETVAYALLARDYGFDLDDATFRGFQDTVMGQDRTIVESQRPELLPLDLQAELHLKSDRLAIAYRRYLQARGVVFGVA